MTDVFISYCRRNKEFAELLHQRLIQDGKDVWIDWEDIPPNADWRQEIYEGIQKTNTVVFVLTPDWLASYECNVELEQAVAHNKRLLPIVYKDVQYKEVSASLASLNWIFFRETDDFEKAYQALITALETDLDHVKYHTKLLNQSIDWDKRDRDSSLLLRGGLLSEAETWLATSQNKSPQPTALQTELIVTSSQQHSKRQRLTIIGTGAALVVSCGLAITAFVQYNAAEQQRRVAEELQTQTLDTTADATFAANDELGGLLAATQANLRTARLSWIDESAPIYQTSEDTLRHLFQRIQEKNRMEGHSDLITNLRVSPDGQFVASTSADNTVRVWRATGEISAILEGHTGTVWTVIFSPDSQTVATSSEDRTVRIWSIDGELLKTVPFDAPMWSVDFHPSDSNLLVASGADSKIQLFDRDGNIRQSWQAGEDKVFSVRFSPEGDRLISGSGDKIARIWDLQGNLLQTFEGHNGEVWAVRFSPDGQTIATASADNTVRLWQADGRLIRVFQGHTSGVISVNFSPSGNYLVSASADHTVRVWNIEDGLSVNVFQHQDIVSGAAFLDDATVVSGSYDKTLRVWAVSTDVQQNLQGHDRRILNVAVGADNNTIATTSTDTTVRLWQRTGDRFVQTLILQRDNVIPNGISLDPLGELVVVGGSDGNVYLWNRQGQLVNTLSGHRPEIWEVTMSNDGQMIASAGGDGTVRIWSRQGELLQVLEGHGEEVLAIAFSPDGTRLASGGADQQINIWSVDGTPLHTLAGHSASVYDLSFSADGQRIVSGSMDNTLKIWSVEGDLLKTIEAHSSGVTSVRFNPADNTIASGSFDNTVKLWREDGTLLHIFEGHEQRVAAIAFSTDGSFLVSGAADKIVKIWDISQVTPPPSDRQALIDQSCQWLSNYLQFNVNLPESDRSVCQVE